jgi:hypothetical protein
MPYSNLRISDSIFASFSLFSSSIRRIFVYSISIVFRSYLIVYYFSASCVEIM